MIVTSVFSSARRPAATRCARVTRTARGWKRLQLAQIRELRHRRLRVADRLVPVDDVLLGRQPVDVAIDDLAVALEQQLDEVRLRRRRRRRGGGHRRVQHVARDALSADRHARRGPLVQQPAVDAVDVGHDREPVSVAVGQVVDRHRPVVVCVQDVQRLVGLLGAEVAAGLVEVVVVEVPQQRRPALVQLPVDDARRRRVLVGRVVDVGLELGPLRLVVLDLRLLARTGSGSTTRRSGWRSPCRGRGACRTSSRRCRVRAGRARSWRGTG